MVQGRRGIGDKVIENIPRIIYVAVVIGGAVFLLNIYESPQVDPDRVKAETVFTRVFYDAPIWVTDGTGNELSGKLNLSTFNDTALSEELRYPEERAAAKLTLTDDNAVVKAAYLNRQLYQQYAPLVNAGAEGSGSAEQFTRTIPVTYVDEEPYGGMLQINVVIPN